MWGRVAGSAHKKSTEMNAKVGHPSTTNAGTPTPQPAENINLLGGGDEEVIDLTDLKDLVKHEEDIEIIDLTDPENSNGGGDGFVVNINGFKVEDVLWEQRRNMKDFLARKFTGDFDLTCVEAKAGLPAGMLYQRFLSAYKTVTVKTIRLVFHGGGVRLCHSTISFHSSFSFL